MDALKQALRNGKEEQDLKSVPEWNIRSRSFEGES